MEETKKIIDLSDRFYLLVVVLIIVVTVAFLGNMAYQFKVLPQNIPHEISVTGEGKAFGKPDINFFILKF
jgi:hypothetical protein